MLRTNASLPVGCGRLRSAANLCRSQTFLCISQQLLLRVLLLLLLRVLLLLRGCAAL